MVADHAARVCKIDALTERSNGRRYIPGGTDLRFPAVLFVGNREPKKNIEALIKVFYAAVQHSALPHKLVLVGKRGWGGVDRRVNQLVRELDFEDRVFRTEYVPQEALPYIYNLADALLFPSIIEGFGLPVLEAMACGTPVICSKDPALLETAGGAALSAGADDLTFI